MRNTRRGDGPIVNALLGGLLYFTLVFAVAFAVGAIRVLFVAPAIGALRALALEVPIVLTVSWLASTKISRRLCIPSTITPRLIMGGFAFTLLMAAEATLSVTVFGQPFDRYLASFGSAASLLGLAGQVGFAALPLIQVYPRRA